MALDTADRETIIGACVILVGAVVLGLAYRGVSRAAAPGYDVVASFAKAEGISHGSDVRLSGVKVGKVVAQSLDKQFRAVITMRVGPNVQLPDDSSASIQTDGLLGAKYISLQPGGDETNLKPGGRIRYTQDSMNVNDLLEMIIAQGEAKHASSISEKGAKKEGPGH